MLGLQFGTYNELVYMYSNIQYRKRCTDFVAVVKTFDKTCSKIRRKITSVFINTS